MTVFSICTEKYSLRSKHRPSLQGRCNDWRQYSRYRSKKQLLLYLLPGYIKNLLKEKLNRLNSYELRIGKSWKSNEVILEWLHFAMASLFNDTTLLDNGLEHVYMRSEVNSNRFGNSNRFENSFRLHGNLHGDFTAATFLTMPRLYCTCANEIF